jgi:serine/threonine protein kinase
MTDRPFNLEPGTQLETIKVGKEIGRGGLSIVYEATHDPFEEGGTQPSEVALKLFSPDARFSDFTRLRARFRLEQWFTNRFIFSRLLTGWYGANGEHEYIVYNKICDSDLKKIIRTEDKRNYQDLLAIIMDILMGVAFLHANGVVQSIAT